MESKSKGDAKVQGRRLEFGAKQRWVGPLVTIEKTLPPFCRFFGWEFSPLAASRPRNWGSQHRRIHCRPSHSNGQPASFTDGLRPSRDSLLQQCRLREVKSRSSARAARWDAMLRMAKSFAWPLLSATARIGTNVPCQEVD